MKIVKWTLKILGIVVILLGILSLFLFTKVDRTPYKEMEYYSKTMNELTSVEAASLSSIGDTLKVGWAQESLISKKIGPLAGYGARQGALHEGVHDSIWSKSFVFDNSKTKYAYVSLDMLIVPMEVTKLLPQALDSLGFNIENVFLTATHSHCSIGGWGIGIAAELFSGEYDPEMVLFITKSIATSIYKANQNKEISKIGYSKVQMANYVNNRLVGDQEGTIDPWFRFVKFTNQSNETALLTTFAAHATCLHHSFKQISGDYPGQLCRYLEMSENVDFAAFSAGAVGSMAPLMPNLTGWEKVDTFSKKLSEEVSLVENFMPLHYDSIVGGLSIDMHLREAQFRVSENIRVRPWVFKKLFGDEPSKITSLKLGNILFVGTPCDFSGELVENLSKKAMDKGLHLIITSFNGGYAGYITKDKWYDRDTYETMTMNWFGPYNGAYFTEVIEKLIAVHAEGN